MKLKPKAFFIGYILNTIFIGQTLSVMYTITSFGLPGESSDFAAESRRCRSAGRAFASNLLIRYNSWNLTVYSFGRMLCRQTFEPPFPDCLQKQRQKAENDVRAVKRMGQRRYTVHDDARIIQNMRLIE